MQGTKDGERFNYETDEGELEWETKESVRKPKKGCKKRKANLSPETSYKEVSPKQVTEAKIYNWKKSHLRRPKKVTLFESFASIVKEKITPLIESKIVQNNTNKPSIHIWNMLQKIQQMHINTDKERDPSVSFRFR